jgi:two-component system nitrate/nitrite response regulator NarL
MRERRETIDILLVDDHALFRESIAQLLAREADFHIVAHCASIDEALGVLHDANVDLVLLDFDLGHQNGLDFIRQAQLHQVDTKILIVTAGVGPQEVAQLIRAGISGVFLKRDSAGPLAQTIRDVMAGRVSFEQDLFQRAVVDHVFSASTEQGERFTKRERQVLSYVFEGLANKEIASRLDVSESSVKATLQQLFAKTGVRTRSQLVRIALERYQHDL